MNPDAAMALDGMRGAGKTTVGRMIAARLGCGFVDTDDEVERRMGRSIRDAFAAGEAGEFRRVEAEVVREVLARPDVVVATGGGSVEDAATRDALARVCTVWLVAPPETLVARCGGVNRPPLTDLGPIREAGSVLARRAPMYAACASLLVDSGGRSPEEVAAGILDYLAARKKKG